MSFVDLHVHSTASDGTLSPRELVSLACSLPLSAIALTDHDTLCGIPEALDSARGTGLEVVPGIELSCLCPTGEQTEKELHILGLFIDHNSPALAEALTWIHRVREDRNQQIIDRFAKDGIHLTLDELNQGNSQTVITRAHFARALKNRQVVCTIDQAFQKYLIYGSPYCPVRKQFTPNAAIRLIGQAGGLAILAHPIQYKLGWNKLYALLEELKDQGLCGVEVWHSSHNQGNSARLRQIARQLSLLPTGGSDFHGQNKPDIKLGQGRGGLAVTHLILDDLKKALHSTKGTV